MLVDTHAHLDFSQFETDRDDVISRAWEAGIRTIVLPGINTESLIKACRIAEKHPHIWFAAGCHPHDAGTFDTDDIEYFCPHPKCIAIGETGLDFYRDLAPRELQEQAFREQLEIAKRFNLPVIIHIREAWPDARRILDEHPDIRGVLHSFSGNEDDLNWALKRGYYIGLGGPVTFGNFEKAELVAKIPPERLLTETDSPYLAPQSHRGKRNEPAYISEITEKLAEIMGISVDELSKSVCRNTSELFDIPLPRFSHRGDAPKNSLSQNFLVDDNIARKICGLAGEGPLCVEIGAGNGELTRYLVRQFDKVWAIEPDWDRMDALKKTGANILPTAFKKDRLAAISEFEGEECVVVGNLPYSDTSPILFALFESRETFDFAVVTVQKEFAERLTAPVGSREYGIPSVLFALFFDIKKGFDISPGCFWPVPKVTSTVLILEPLFGFAKNEICLDSLKTVVRAAFAHRRKTIRNSMLIELPAIDIDRILEITGIQPDARAETIPPSKFVELADNYATIDILF
ncbi:ribosomal RNA small subunit methyltransferase A [bacterium]|nr:MAG: ribosomal RNA small subunit methyltransferase A [bacterium]